MRAAVLTKPGSFEFTRSYPEPQITNTDIKLKISYSGVCGSDLHIFAMKEPIVRLPHVLGHEFCGEVVEIGQDAKGFKLGDKAVGIIDPSCGVCDYCRQGDFTLCETRSLFERTGAFSDFITAPASQMFAVPHGTPDDEATLIEPVAVALHAVRRSRLSLGENAVVIGGGPLGLLIMLLARQAGAQHVVLVEPAASRREVGSKLGATLALKPGPEAEEAVRQLNGGQGAEVAFEVSGNVEAFRQARNFCRKQGRLIMVAAYETDPLPFSPNAMLAKELEISATFSANALDFQRAIRLVSNRNLDVRPLISGRTRLENVQQVFENLLRNKEDQIKVLLSNQ